MRVILLTPEYAPFTWGGVGTHVRQLAVGLARRGHEVHTFSFAPHPLPTASDAGVTSHYLSPSRPSSEYWIPSLSDVAEVNAKCGELARRLFGSDASLPHVIHLHGWYGVWAARSLKSEFAWPVVLTAHGVHRGHGKDQSGEEREPQSDQLEENERLAIKTANRVVAVSHSLRRELIKEYELDEDSVSVIWNGLEPEALAVPTGEEADWPTLDLFFERIRSRRLLLFAGRVVPEKGALALLRAFAELLRRDRSIQLIIAGEVFDPKYAELLRSLVNDDPVLNEHTIFAGKLSRPTLQVLYQHAYLVAVPSLEEPFGYVAVEAMAHGKPVIASNIGGLAEIVEEGETGILVPVEKVGDNGSLDVDSAALSSAIRRLLDDPLLASRLGARGRERFLSQFTAEQMAVNTEQLYADVLARHLKQV